VAGSFWTLQARCSAWRRGLGAISAGFLVDEEASETLALKQSRESCQHRPVRRLQRRSLDLAPQHCYLVAQHDDLDGQIGILVENGSGQLEDARERPIEEREGTAGCSQRPSQPSQCWLQGTDGIVGTHMLATSLTVQFWEEPEAP